MRKKVTIYHNPRCSKSRQTLELLQAQGIEPIIVEYLKSPLTKEQLIILLKELKMLPREILRRGEKEYKQLNLDNSEMSAIQIVDAIVAHPLLMERPIVSANGKAVIGRPAEKIFEVI